MAELLTLARPYAKAIFSLAKESDDFNGWSDKLSLLSEITVYPEVAELRDNPNVDVAELVSFYQDVAHVLMDEQTHSLVQILATNGRLGLLPEIYALYEQHKAEWLKRIDVELTSAVALSPDQTSKFVEKLKTRFGREVNLTCVTDPALVGGAVIRAGDKVIDGSVRGKLYQMAEELGA